MARYPIAIFLSAFLLFQVQPLIGKYILPWYGGGPAVWTACMLFFQVFLLAGYAYAHLVASRLSPRAGTVLHWGLLAASLAFLPIAPNAAAWKQTALDVPVAQIAGLLAATIGLPYFMLSSTGPLLQESFRRETGHAPYRLYALSNAGSLLALLSYPFVFEPELTLRIQIVGWSSGYGLFAALSAWCILGLTKLVRPAANGDEAPGAAAIHGQQGAGRPRWGDVLLWVALAACGSTLLLATTNQLCLEVTTVPFLWVLPLALYLSTFIICFDHDRWYHRTTFLLLMIGSIFAAYYALFEGTGLQLWKQVAVFSTALWMCCMMCHGELVRIRPAPHYATLFYLMVAAGGAAGGVLVAIVAPLVLPDFWEYQISLFASVVLAFIAAYRSSAQSAVTPVPLWIAGTGVTTVIGLAIIGVVAGSQADAESNKTRLETTRNFYGVLRVERVKNLGHEKGPYVELVHGRIQHGYQFVEPAYRRLPTTYYGPSSGIGRAIQHHPRRAAPEVTSASGARADNGNGGLRIGVVGLGCGTLAAYGKPGDTIRFYDINPAVIRIANEYFTYCKDSQAKVDVVLGDARLKLEQELAAGQPQRFDVLAIDAFSSDSIPMHLLTKECVELYRQHLKPDGLLCLHLSNRYLNLESVARGVAEAVGCECVRINSEGSYTDGLNTATWLILTNNRVFLESPHVRDAILPWTQKDPAPILWTDDYGSLWRTLKN